jgi:two-component system, OmpR family, sensor kinase
MPSESGAPRRPAGRSRSSALHDSLTGIGLRWRLAGWVTLVILVFSAVTFVAVYSGTGDQLRSQIDGEIAGEAGDLVHAVALARGVSARQMSATAEHYIRSRPFSASSNLLFAIVPGVGVATNRPELFSGYRPDHGETAAEQDQENRLARQLNAPRLGYSTLDLPDVGDLRLLERSVAVSVGRRVTVGVGEPLASVAHAQRGVARSFILAGIITLAGAMIASFLVGTHFSRPLRRMAAVVARVDGGDLHPRIHDPGSGANEVRVLAESFNHMLDRLTEAFAGQRAFVADASHELRTPLTVIRGQLEVLAAQAQPSGSEVRRVEHLVQAEISRITRLVDDLLVLARAEHSEFLRTEQVDLQSYVHELWQGVSPLADRRFELGELPEGTLQADPDRLAQALRNLIANAIEHTAEGGLVRLEVRPLPGGRVSFVLSDDGPGIPGDQRELIFERFHRTDEGRDRASGGTGLGLAIVRVIAEAHGGRVSAGERAGGGALIELELPHFRVSPARPYASSKPRRPRPTSTSRSPTSA